MPAFKGDAMTDAPCKPLDILSARAANCRAKAASWRQRAVSAPREDDLRTNFFQVAERYDALADGVELKHAREIHHMNM
jgi:hypothetical protein